MHRSRALLAGILAVGPNDVWVLGNTHKPAPNASPLTPAITQLPTRQVWAVGSYKAQSNPLRITTVVAVRGPTGVTPTRSDSPNGPP